MVRMETDSTKKFTSSQSGNKMLFGGLQDEITQSELELRAEQMMELSRISDEELEKINDDKSSIRDLAQMMVPPHLHMAEECQTMSKIKYST